MNLFYQIISPSKEEILVNEEDQIVFYLIRNKEGTWDLIQDGAVVITDQFRLNIRKFLLEHGYQIIKS